MQVLIRREESGDRSRVRAVNEAAFARRDEADLVDRLREEGAVLLSLAAEWEGRIVGHILFSRMTVEWVSGSLAAAALAPMAVEPAWQRQQVGSRLIRAGLAELRAAGESVVIVLGHRDYYPRFGFSLEAAMGLAHPFRPGAPLMALELREGAPEGLQGAVRYAAAFGL